MGQQATSPIDGLDTAKASAGLQLRTRCPQKLLDAAHETARARSVQSDEPDLAQLAVPFDRKHRLMADEVHGEEDTFGPANEACQEPDVLHLAAVMM